MNYFERLKIEISFKFTLQKISYKKEINVEMKNALLVLGDL